MPKKANGMHSNPRITMAIQPEVFSRSFCSIGQECRDEAGQFTRNGSGGPHAARRHASAQEKGLLPNEETADPERRSEEHTSELQSLMRITYAVFCLKTQ